MAQNLSPIKLYEFIVNDFESAWDCLAASQSAKGRGNFMFARQAMTLLEFAARLCSDDTSGGAVKEFSEALHDIEPKYFTPLPGVCSNLSTEFELPHIGPDPQRQLIWAMFDLIRHGQAHQYQQIVVALTDGVDFQFTITGASAGQYLCNFSGTSDPKHLGFWREPPNNFWMLVFPGRLFLDLKGAIESSCLLKRCLAFPYLSRPSRKGITKSGRARKSKGSGPLYQFDSISLERSLASAGHLCISPRP